MIIDKSHRLWCAATLTLLAIATASYVVYARRSPLGATGGSIPGMLFGITSAMLMIAAGLLAARKQVPRWPLGTAQAWLRGHIWLGLLAVPLMFFHSGFRFGGLLEQLLIGLVLAVTVSGVFGLALQHVLPRLMRIESPRDVITEQAAEVCDRLRADADRAVCAVCGPLLAMPTKPDDETVPLRDFYLSAVRPFLSSEPSRSRLQNRSSADAIFAQVRGLVPGSLHGVLDELRAACDERRQIAVQMRLHRWLHGWLLLHVPLSAALLVLGVAHVVTTMYVF